MDFQYGERLTTLYHFRRWHRDVYHYRIDPVPRCRKWRGGGGFHRFPQTLRAISHASAWTDEGIASSVKDRSLPHAWDDLPRNKPQRSWKQHRNAQYRRIANIQ